MSKKRSKHRLELMLRFMEPKLHSNVSIKSIQSMLFLEHPSTTGNSKLRRTKKNKLFSKRKGEPNPLSDDLMAKVKTITTADTAISRHIVMAIVIGVVKSNSPILLKENGRSLQLTEDKPKIRVLDEGERYSRENRAVPTIPFRRKVNFSE